MSCIYVMQDDGSTKMMARVRCQNEDYELQRILEKNPNLLPGDQIDPENPRQWLLIKREMPVPDPCTGLDRWSIDFVFADQDAIPTFVECKRFSDTRSRREIVGQMLEYAANGHYYWSKDMLRGFAENTAKQKGVDLDESICALRSEGETNTDVFFECLQKNLREGQLRIIFFLEESPSELRSVVDFLNKQMERSEVLLVEARQYMLDGQRIVAPTLFGYTEEARQAKRAINPATMISSRKWDRDSYFSDAASKLSPLEVQILETLLDQSLELGSKISWGNGQGKGSFDIKEPSICSGSLLSVYSDGRININFGSLSGSEARDRSRKIFRSMVSEKTGFDVLDDSGVRHPGYSIAEWGNKVNALLEVLKEFLERAREPN